MADTHPVHFKQQYADTVTLLQQQMGSNLRDAVDSEQVSGEFNFFDQIAATSMEEVEERHGDTKITEAIHRRRRVSMADFSIAHLIDNPDTIRTMNSPQNAYVRNQAMAAGRRTDETIIAAFDATVATGKTGTGSDAFDTANFQIAVGTSNLTTAKLRTARKLLEAAQNLEDTGDNQWYCACSADQREGLLGQTDFTSSDFNSIKSLVDGDVKTWLGFHFLKSELLPLASTTRSVFCWNKSSMKLAIGAEPRGYIDVRPDKNHATQVRYTQTLGAVRMDQVGVVEILCNESL